MQIIINSKYNSKIEVNKFKIEINKFSKTKIDAKVNKLIIFFIIDLIINLALKFNKIIYISKTKK